METTGGATFGAPGQGAGVVLRCLILRKVSQLARRRTRCRPRPLTVVSNHEGEDGMGSRSMTVGRYEEIRRRLAEGRGLREIARALNCSRDTIREVRDGARQSPDAAKPPSDPLWMLQLEWPATVHNLGLGHPLKLMRADGVAHQGPEQWPWSS